MKAFNNQGELTGEISSGGEAEKPWALNLFHSASQALQLA